MQQAAAAFGDGLPDFELEGEGSMAAGGEPVCGPAECGVNALGWAGGGAGHGGIVSAKLSVMGRTKPLMTLLVFTRWRYFSIKERARDPNPCFFLNNGTRAVRLPKPPSWLHASRRETMAGDF